jgi:hypothetical protein
MGVPVCEPTVAGTAGGIATVALACTQDGKAVVGNAEAVAVSEYQAQRGSARPSVAGGAGPDCP